MVSKLQANDILEALKYPSFDGCVGDGVSVRMKREKGMWNGDCSEATAPTGHRP